MRVPALPLAVATLVTLMPGFAVAQQPGDVASEILAAERALAEGLHTRSQPQLDRLLAPAFVLRGSPDIDRATWIQNAVTLCWGDRSEMDRFAARGYGDVAVASLELTFFTDPVTCAPAVLRSLITDIWVRQADGWRLQVRHTGPAGAADSVAAQFGAVPLPPPTWEVNTELSLVGTAGNTSTLTIGAGGGAIHRTDAATTRAAVAFVTSEADDVTRARALTVNARHGFRVVDRVELFGDASYARDRFAGILDRITTAAGVAYTDSPWPRHAMTVEGSVGVTRENRLDTTDLRFAIATGAVDYAWTVTPGTEVDQHTAVTVDLQGASNWRGTSRTAISVRLTRLLSLEASHALEYRHLPVAGFRRLDMRSAAALVLSLERRPRVP